MQMPGPTQFSNPPPMIPNLNVPPPTVSVPPPGQPPPTGGSSIQVPLGPPPSYGHQHHYGGGRGGHRHFFQPFRPYMRPGPGPPGQAGLDEFDGKRLRKSVMRKTVDYNSSIIKALECRVWQRDARDKRALQPDVTYYPNMEPPPSYVENPINSVVTRFVKTATNKMRCPIFCMAWTPEGRRLVTGASSGEFTLWNGLTFNFETILQAHDSPVRTMVWSHNDTWMVTGDHMGYVKYWQSNMNNVKMFQAHKEAIRGLSFSPTDQKFVTCSDDGTLRIWDFLRCHEERILRGHGADVKCVHWHPQKSLIISGSKDNQQPIKLWDPKTGTSLATLHAHKSTVMDIKWNENGNWLVTASRDHLLKLFDIRNLSTEVQTFRGHKKEASSVAWHPHHEGLFCSGGSDGAILFWHVGADKEVGAIEQAHDSIVWTLAWHPLGHILCSGSNDHTSKFWTRNRPGDAMRDKYNLNTLPAGLAGMDDQDIDDNGVIPGMGPEDKVEESVPVVAPSVPATIPGLDFEGVEDRNKHYHKKVPYSKPIPRNFVAQWNETGEHEADSSSDDENGLKPVLNPIAQALRAVIENTTIPGCIPLNELQPQAIIMYGKILPVEGDNVLSSAIAAGGDTLQRLVASGQIEEFQDVMPHLDEDNFSDYSNEDCMDIEGSLDNLQMPAPLPSSIFAKKGGPVAQRKTRFSDPEPVQQGLAPRNLPPSLTSQEPQLDPKAQEDEDLRILRDIDMRLEMMNNVANLSAPAIAMGGNPIGMGSGPSFGGPPHGAPGWGGAAWADGLRPGLNNFGTRNFVSSGNFDDPPFAAGANGSSTFAPNDPRGNTFNTNEGFDNGNQFGGSWGGPGMGGPRNQMGPRQMGPNMPMGHNGPMGSGRSSMQGNMGPGMGPGGPNMGPRHTMMAGGPPMGIRHPMGSNMGPGGPNIGSGGPNMGPGGPNMGGGMNMGQGGPNMGPGGPNMGPGGPNMGPGGPNMGPSGPNMGGGMNMGQGGPNMGPGGPNMGPGGPNMGPGGPNMGPMGPGGMGPGGPNMGGGSNMGPGGPNMGAGGPNMGGMGSGMQMGPGFQNQNSFYRGGGRGFSRGRGNFDNSRGGGFDNGYNSNRGGFEGNRGGFDGNRGSFEGKRGGFEGSRGGFDGNRGGFEGKRGSFEGGRSGFEGKRGGFDGNRGGFNNGNRSFDKDQGSFDSKRGGFDNNRGDYDGGRGKDRSGNEGRESSGSSRASRFSGSRGSKSRGYSSSREKDN